jgi:tellurite resistance protein TehA-like permease
MPQISGAWFIPPVVTIIVPLAMLPLVAEFDDLAGDLLAIAWGFLGVGTLLYILVAATLFLRSVSHPLPPAALAPTLIIGMGPAGLIGLDLVRLAQVGAAAGVGPADQVALAALPATMMWGFGAWWLVSALLVLRRGYDALPFGLSWWGFTFPVAAWTISTIVLGRVWGAAWLDWFGIAAVVALLVLWLYVLVRTVIGIRRGTIWAH